MLSEYKFQPNINEQSVIIDKKKRVKNNRNATMEAEDQARWNHLYSMVKNRNFF